MKSLTLFAIAWATAFSAAAQMPKASARSAGFDSDRMDRLHERIHRFVEEGNHAGVITLLARGGKIADFRAYGYRDLEQRLPMEKDTICRVYSMSKIITCVGTLILFEDGRFHLDEPVSKFLPERPE